MLRINLLPPYIFDKQKKVQLAIAWLVVVGVVVALFILWSGSLGSQLQQATQENTDAKNLQNQTNDYQNQITAAQQKNADVVAKQTFIANAKTYNDAWPDLYDQMRDLTSDRVLLEQMSVDGSHKAVNFSGFAPSEMDIVRWWMQLRNNTATIDHVTFTLPAHGYLDGSPGGAPQTEVEGRPGLNFAGSVELTKPLAGGMGAPSWPPGSEARSGGMGGPAGFGPPGGMGGFGPPTGMPGVSGPPGGFPGGMGGKRMPMAGGAGGANPGKE
ncbi:MAG TPA: hypothetical protein VKT32_14955 [Chthonomonadaceae bacterium]|nr:hypothetical protein [Chthonomonadaceae bacterium]